MAFIERDSNDRSNVSEMGKLNVIFELQKKDFKNRPFPSVEERQEKLACLSQMMMDHRYDIQEALREDFGCHPSKFSDLAECMNIVNRAQIASENLSTWLAPQVRETNPLLYGSGKAYVQYQPKGVVGNMAPWNFPFDIGFGPVVEMLAAGNRVIIKPSDLSPACSELTEAMVRKTFDPLHVATVSGGVELAQHFSTLQWDHLMYTGSTEVGRSVALSAAKNLVPTTLELGGKCPAIVDDSGINIETVEQIVGCKMIKNGQMCVSVDYVIVPEGRDIEFSELIKDYLTTNMPDYINHEDVTGIISVRHKARLLDYLEDARSKGGLVIPIGGEIGSDLKGPQSHLMPFVVVLNATEDMDLMKNEIFGPILPVVTYQDFESAISYINDRDRPLGVYAFTSSISNIDKILSRTVSGGACINVAATHAGIPTLPFGGVGKSGSGRHHGYEGFLEFSNPRAVFERGENDMISALFPPYGNIIDDISST